MKKASELGLISIEIGNDFFLCDPNFPTKLEEWCFEMHNGESAAENPIIWVDDKNNKWYLRRSNMNCGPRDPECLKIIASNKRIRGIHFLKVVDWAEELSYINNREKIPGTKEREINDEILISGARIIGFQEGYKEHSKVYRYTKQDIIDAFFAGAKDKSQNILEELFERLDKKEFWIEVKETETKSSVFINSENVPYCSFSPKVKDDTIKGTWK